MHEDFTDDDRNTIRIRNNTIYRHQTMRVNYTTYDIRRDFDVINPRSRPFCMTASPETEANPNAHPFWYAEVIRIFHANVQHTGTFARDLTWKVMDFLWVRWLGTEPDYFACRQEGRLPKFGFVPSSDDFAFSFLDPAHVVRGCHLIPTFAAGRTSELLSHKGPTEARKGGETDDWANYYINMCVLDQVSLANLLIKISRFADRDIYMRHLGLGVGHSAGTSANRGVAELLGNTGCLEVDMNGTGEEGDEALEGNEENGGDAEVDSSSEDGMGGSDEEEEADESDESDEEGYDVL